MSNWDDNWSNNNDWGNNSNWENENSHDDSLNNITEESAEENSIEDILRDDEPINEGNDDDGLPDEEGAEESDATLGSLIDPPANIKADKRFSERDIYKVVNVTTTLSSAQAEQLRLIQSLFDIHPRTNIVKQAITLVDFSAKEVSSRIDSVDVLDTIRKMANQDFGDSDPIAFTLNVASRVSSMPRDERANMLKVLSAIMKDVDNSARLKVNKGSSDFAVVEEVRNVFSENEHVANVFSALEETITILKEALSR